MCFLRRRGKVRRLVRLQPGQHLFREQPDLVHEHVVRQRTGIHAHMHRLCTGPVHRVDDPLGHLVGGSPRHRLGALLDLVHGEVAVAFAQPRRLVHVLRPYVVEGGIAHVAGLALQRSLGDVAVAEQAAIEVEKKRACLLHRLRLAVGDVGALGDAEMPRRDAVAGERQASGVVADDVGLQPAGAAFAGGYGDVVPGGELDQLLAGGDRRPDRRVRLLHRPRPQRDIPVAVEFSLKREDLLGPRPRNDLEGLLEARARLRHRYVMHRVFARDAAGDAGDETAIRQAVDHGQLLGQPQRLVQRKQVAVDQELEPRGPLRCSRSHQVGRVHQPVRRCVVLVEANAIVAEPVEQLPGLEMLGIGAHRDLGLEA